MVPRSGTDRNPLLSGRGGRQSLLLTAMVGPKHPARARRGRGALPASDTLIATGVADWPQLPRPDFWIMLTYVAAQFLLVQGVLGTLAERRAPAAAYREVRSTTP